MDLSFVLYRSTARRRITEDMMVDILAASARNNPREGLTGFLHVDRGCFLQYIEGPTGPLSRKVRQIQADRRHKDFQVLGEGPVDERIFPDWDMGRIELPPNSGHDALIRGDWHHPEKDIDPIPLVLAFAAVAGVTDDLQFEES